MEKCIQFEGCNYFRQRLVLATLSSRAVRITKIREDSEEPGLHEYEAGFIRLLDKLTNGSKIEVNETGTSLYYEPGLLIGGKVEHECSRQRSVGYFLEPLMQLAPFSKRPLCISLKGITNGPKDPSVDYYRMCVLPLLKKILPNNNLELKMQVRGVWPEGVGQVTFSCPVVRKMKPLLLMDEGRVRRVRGVAHCVRVSPSMASRMVDSARKLLNHYLPDVYIYTDVVRGKEAGRSPGFGLTLVSESTSNVTHAGETSTYSNTVATATSHTPATGGVASRKRNRSAPVGDDEGMGLPGSRGQDGQHVLPEDIGQMAACRLLEEIVQGGCVDSSCQVLPLLFMALGQRDVSKIQLGQLSPYTIQFLRHLKQFFQVTFNVQSKQEELKEDEHEKEEDDEDSLGLAAVKAPAELTREIVTLSCVGIGYSNFSKGIM